jgi:hypothetical protein
MFAFFIVTSSIKAQVKCPYAIKNNLNCKVTVNYTIMDPNNCSLVCASGSGTIPPGGNITIPCSDLCSNSAACNLFVNVTQVGPNPPTPNPVTVNMLAPTAGGTAPGPCPNVNLVWTLNQTNINP